MRQYRALVVDDEEQVRNSTARILGRAGFNCQVAGCGREALQLIDNEDYDLVVTDLKMPQINGHRLATELLAREHRPVIAVLTGIKEPKLVSDLAGRGVDRVYLKPVDFLPFVNELYSLVDGRAKARLGISELANETCQSVSDMNHELHATGDFTVNDDGSSQVIEPSERESCAEVSPNPGWPAVAQQLESSRAVQEDAIEKRDNKDNFGSNNSRQVASLNRIELELNRTKKTLIHLEKRVAGVIIQSYLHLTMAAGMGLLMGLIAGGLGSIWLLKR